MLKTLIEEAKEALTNTRLLRKYIFLECLRKNEKEPKYPKRFWQTHVYSFRVNLEKCSIPKDIRLWKHECSYSSYKLEEAIAHAVVGSQDDKEFEKVEIPDHLKSRWSLWQIEAYQSVYIKEKWGEKDLRSICGINYFEFFDGKDYNSYNESFSGWEYALCQIPSKIAKLTEQMPYGLCTPEVIKDPVEEKFPYFIYKNHVFKTTYYIHDQRCVCGNSSSYYNDYEEDNSVKVEVWEVDRFLKKDIIYNIDGWLFCNNEKCQAPKKHISFKQENEFKKLLKEKFPHAKEYDSWEMSFSI